MKTSITLCAMSAAMLMFAGCDRRDNTTVGQKIDAAVSKTEAGATSATQAMQEKTAGMAQTVNDATITAAVNADLARDSELSALRINVDTRDGRVSLYGSAPTDKSRQRAERLAQAEKGVVAVDNKLVVERH